jgi:hypothetical protein
MLRSVLITPGATRVMGASGAFYITFATRIWSVLYTRVSHVPDFNTRELVCSGQQSIRTRQFSSGLHLAAVFWNQYDSHKTPTLSVVCLKAGFILFYSYTHCSPSQVRCTIKPRHKQYGCFPRAHHQYIGGY